MSYSNKWAKPGYLAKEDPLNRGGARTTPWKPRGTISRVPKGSKLGGYAVPQYVRDEPLGTQAKTTPWLPRGTISNTKGLGIKADHSVHSLEANGLGALGTVTSLSGNSIQGGTVGGGDPIVAYGAKAAALVISEFKSVSPDQREAGMRKLLSQVDPGLWFAAQREAKQLREHGAPAGISFQRGLAIAFSNGLTKEFVKLGKSGKGPKRGQLAVGALYGCLGCGIGAYQEGNYHQSVGGLWSSITKAASSTLSKLGGLACDVATHPLTPLAAGAGAAATGGSPQVGMAGAAIANSVCTTSGEGGSYTPPPPSGAPAWLLPAAIGGGALLLIIALK